MKKILFPFYNREIHQHLLPKKWFSFACIGFSILGIFIACIITLQFTNKLYLHCYNELSSEQDQQTLNAVREINSLDFNDSGSELKALQIKREYNNWYNDKSSECKNLADEYSVYVIPFGISVLIIIFYLTQFIFFRFIRKSSANKKI